MPTTQLSINKHPPQTKKMTFLDLETSHFYTLRLLLTFGTLIRTLNSDPYSIQIPVYTHPPYSCNSCHQRIIVKLFLNVIFPIKNFYENHVCPSFLRCALFTCTTLLHFYLVVRIDRPITRDRNSPPHS